MEPAGALLEHLAASALGKAGGHDAARVADDLAWLSSGVAAAKRLPLLVQVAPRVGAPHPLLQTVESAMRHAAATLAAQSAAAHRGTALPLQQQQQQQVQNPGGSARQVLVCQLLRLAAEGGGQAAAAAPSAALAALDCLPWRDVEALPGDALANVLLLRPALLDRLVEGAARSACAGDADDRLPTSSRRAAAPAAQPLSDALALHTAWRHLPSILAAQPALHNRVVSTLLAWWQLSAHPRLWQLMSAACRPMWQQLLAAGGPEGGGSQEQQCGSPTQQQQQESPDQQRAKCKRPPPPSAVPDCPPAVLLCHCPGALPALPALLLQTPTRAALRRLLAALPGRSAADNTGLPWDCLIDGSLQLEGEAGEGESDGWPTEDAWRVAGWGEEPGAAGTQPAHGAAAVDAAWRLVMQHRCWYDYAVWVLAHSSLRLATMPGSSSQPMPPATQQQQQQLLLLTQAATQAAPGGRKQRGPGSREDALRDAAAAAEFISWVVVPYSPHRQCALRDQLLSCAATAQPGSSQALPLDAAADALVSAWRAAAGGDGALSPDGSGGSGGGGGGGGGDLAPWPWWLAGVDLPLALALHPALLLHGHSNSLLSTLLQPSGGSQAAQQQGGAEPLSTDSAPRPTAAQQMLSLVLRGQAADSLEGLAAAVRGLLTQAGLAAGGGTAPSPERSGGSSRGWLGACIRHVLVSWALPLEPVGRATEQQQQGGPLRACLEALQGVVSQAAALINGSSIPQQQRPQ